ncbi:ATP-binding protein [Pseudobdellovibrio sp. HCB154]|uniref:ATP-binding protein n=1 Tax=Pseudobdellovibrio sp. HCB154 TaxID=3386277 RepID=UPI0039175CDB
MWNQVGEKWEFSASSSEVANTCGEGKSLVFPQVVHGIHTIHINNELFLQTGDDSFSKTSAFYSRAVVDCKYIKKNAKVDWHVITYSKYFARINKFPSVENTTAKYYFFDVILNILSAGCLLILAVFSLFIFSRRVENKYVLSLFIGSVSFATYSVLTTANIFDFDIRMIYAHKVADVFVWIGSYSYIYFFHKYGYLGKIELRSFIAAFILGESLIIFGGSPDVVQLGTTIPIPFAFICLSSFLIHSINEGFKKGFDRNIKLGIFSISIFVLAGMNDLLHITGLIDSYMIMPLGSVAGVFFLAAAVNQNIEVTYVERDELLINLENKVIEKTKHLEEALTSLKSTQAELVQSAKLASLGTVSAGIAHEINNSINYVSGAIIPLEKKVYAMIPETADRKMIEKLFGAIKEGTSLTVDIVKSLRNFTGLNQAEFKEIRIQDSVHSIQTILKSKLRGIDFKYEFSPDCIIHGNLVGFNQVFMNLISNGLDALDKNEKFIHIKGSVSGNQIVISIKDNGKGIKTEILNKIFDPFFTTKDVGKGTGLGLHIVSKEIERHGGQIKVFSELNVGTEFLITLPAFVDSNKIREAA